MNSTEFIKSKQVYWARINNISLQGSQKDKGESLYVMERNDNLFEPLRDEFERQFREGDGNELGNGTTPGKIQALHSSAALACNVFHYWASRKDFSPLASALLIPKSYIKNISFEVKLPILKDVSRRQFPHDPNLDILISYSDGALREVGIECKFCEPYDKRPQRTGLKEAYLNYDELWQDMPNLLSLGRSISPEDNDHHYLHPAQLIKHIFGLRHSTGNIKGFRLIYLWYDVPFDEGAHHRQEIMDFRKIARSDGVDFQSLTYQELINNLAEKQNAANKEYIDYLLERYY